MVELVDNEVINYMANKLYQKLTEGLHTRQLVNVSGFRRIGKTTALVRFARERNIPIITVNHSTMQYIKNNFGYDQVYTVSQGLRGRFREAVIDEMVDENRVREQGVEIITGYFCYYS